MQFSEKEKDIARLEYSSKNDNEQGCGGVDGVKKKCFANAGESVFINLIT